MCRRSFYKIETVNGSIYKSKPSPKNSMCSQKCANPGTSSRSKRLPILTDKHAEAWSQSLSELRMQVVAEAGIVAAGRKIQFFIEDDMAFTLPDAMYDTDESLFIRIPEAGIDKAEFKYSSRVGREAKTFTISKLKYGDNSPQNPLQLTDVTLEFQPNVVLTEGATVRTKNTTKLII